MADIPLKGGKRSSLLYWQRLNLLAQARQFVSRLTILVDQAISDGLPGVYVMRLNTVRERAVKRQVRRSYDASHHKSTVSSIARGGKRHP